MVDTAKRTSTPQPGLPADFYAPAFRIEVEGRELSPQSLGNVMEVRVDMGFSSPAHFELVLDHWDDRRADFKVLDFLRSEVEIGAAPAQLDLGQRVFIEMGYAGRLLPMLRGQVTALSADFSESGARRLIVSGLDGMFDLTGRAKTQAFPNMTDWEIAQEIATGNGFLRTRVTKEGPKHREVVQQGQDDAAFLKSRARRIGFDFFIRTGPAAGEDETLVFVKSESCETSKAPVYVFEWGKNLIHFQPKLDVSEQVGEVVVRSSNPKDQDRPFKVSARPGDLPSGGGRNGPAVIETFQKGKQILADNARVDSEEEARLYAVSLLRETAYKYSTGSAKGIGFPDLRPGDNVQILGVGDHFGGCYQVSQVTHMIDGSGYFTTFNVRRVHDGGSRP